MSALKPTAPPTKTRVVASRSDAVASAPTSAPRPNAAERRPKVSAPTSSVCEARSGTSTWKLKPTRLITVITVSTIRATGAWYAQASPSRIPGEDARLRALLDGIELLLAHQLEREEHREEADGVDDEAEARADERDHDAGDGGADHARAVEEPGVERDGVLQLLRADHLERERLATRRVEDEHQPADGRQGVDDRERRQAGQRDDGERDRDEHRRPLGGDQQPPRVEAVDHDAGGEPEQEERDEPAERERADGEGRAGELDHEPRERDVLHPRAGERDDLAREEEPVVPVAVEGAEGSPAEPERKDAHGRGSRIAARAGRARSRPSRSSSVSRREPVREPRRAAGADAPEQRPALRGQLEADAAAVVARPDATEQPRRLEPVDVTGEGRCRDALLARELAEREPWPGVDEPEERGLMRGDAERLGLEAEVARQPQEHRPELLGEIERRKRSLTNH